MARLFLLLILNCICFSAGAQNAATATKKENDKKENAYRLMGTVREEASGIGIEPMPDVTIQLFALPDTVFVDGAVTNKRGIFEVYTKKPGNYLLKASFLGFETLLQKVNVAAYEREKYVSALKMNPKSILLSETVIKAELQKMKMDGDTLVYNTDAFKTSEGAVLQDLVRQMPGLTLDKEGGLTFNGKKIQQILLNGKEFFGDMKVALENMPVNALKEVKVYDKASDKERMTGVSDGNKQTVMDMKTKKNLTDGMMGEASVSGGTEDLYGTRVNLNRFTGKWKMSFNGDLGKLPVSSRYSMNSTGNMPAINKNVSLFTGAELGKFKVNGNISFRDSKNENDSQTASENYLPNGNQYNFSVSNSMNKAQNLFANFNVDGDIDEKTKLTLRQNIIYGLTDSFNDGNMASFNADPRIYTHNPLDDDTEIPKEIRINKNSSHGQNTSKNFNSGTSLVVSRKLNDIGRLISVELNNNYSSRTNDNFNQSAITYYQLQNQWGGDSILQRNQYRTGPSKDISLSAEVVYTEPISKHKLQVYYNYGFQGQSSDANTYELGNDVSWGRLPEGYETGKIDSLTDFTRNYRYTHEMGVRSEFDFQKVTLGVRLGLQPQKSTTKSDRGKIKIDTTVNVLNIRPEIDLNYKFGKSNQLTFRYNGYTIQPSIYDLLPVADYSDPLNVTMGNPGLKPSFTQSFMVFMMAGRMEKQEMLFLNLSFNNQMNQVSRKVIYDELTGVRTSRPENINGNWSANGNISYSGKMLKILNFRLNTRGNYTNNVSYLQIAGDKNAGDRNKSRTLLLGQEIELVYRVKEHEFKLNGNIDYQKANNSYNSKSDYETYDFSYGVESRIKLPLNLGFYTIVKSMNRRGYKDDASNTTRWLWNGELTYNFLKGKKGILKLEVVDILQQQDFVYRWLSAQGQSEVRTKGLGRYGMLSFTYRFNNLSRKMK